MDRPSSTTSVANNVASLLVRTAQRHPLLPALALGSRAIADYATLARRVGALAATLRRHLAVGDRVLLASRNTPESIEVLFGCWHAGLCAVPANAKLHPAEMAYMASHSGARWAFVDEAWASALSTLPGGSDAVMLERVVVLGSNGYRGLFDRSVTDAVADTLTADASASEASASEASTRRASRSGASMPAPSPVAPNDPAWIFYTSGTTGRPKGVILSHANLMAMSLCFLADVEPVAPGDSILHAAPLSHGSGLYVLPHVLAGAVNVIPESRGFDAAEILSLLPAWRNVRMFAAPTMVRRIVDHPSCAAADLSNLVSIIYGGGPMYVEDCRRAHAALGPRLAQIYGQGESPMTITAMPRSVLDDAIARHDDARMASVGTAQPGIDIRIADDAGNALPTGEVGEVLVRGATIMEGYWNDPEATHATLADGWLHTGDLGFVDADGFLTLKDRSKDLIISGGSNIYPREVEEALLAHPGVAEVSVIGRAHPEWGEEVVACVVLRDPGGVDTLLATIEAELDGACLQRIARFKRPRAYVFVAELPKNNAGKVLKTTLRDQLTSGLAPPRAPHRNRPAE